MDIIKYFTFLTGHIPTDSQKTLLLDFVDLAIHKLIISAGCQSGKTLCSAIGALWWVFESGERVNVLLISAQDSILYYHIREMFKKHTELSEQLTSPFSPNLIPLRGFELKNGNQVFVRGSTEKQLSGIPANIVIIDEACLVKRDIILEGMNRLTQPIAKFVLLSTPSKPNSLFVQWTHKKSGFKVNQWSSEGLSWHDKEIDAQKKKDYGPSKYAVYMLGRPPSKEEQSTFSRKHLEEKCIKSHHLEREGGPNSRIEIGLDWGFDPCKTVCTVREKIGSRCRILVVKWWSKKPLEDFADELVSIIMAYPDATIKADSKPPEYGEYMRARYPKLKIHYLAGEMYKDQQIEQFGRHIDQGSLEIGEDEVELIKQIIAYRKGMRTGDLVDAALLACFEPLTPLWKKKVNVEVFVGIRKK